MNEEVQNLYINLKIHDVIIDYITYDTSDIVDESKKKLLSALKCIA